MLNWNDVLNFGSEGNPEPDRTVTKTEEEWQEQLTLEQYQIIRLKGTERPYSSEMCELFEPGNYACLCCDTLLFDSSGKFDSGTGWPSFSQPAKENAIAHHSDGSHGMTRIEVTCNTCDAHLGHVFPDGPEPSGLRYCINAISMTKLESD
jgi:methionine-R-sulfoxide reductase